MGNKVTLKGIIDRAFLETMFFSKNNSFRMLLFSELCRGCGKGRHWTNECRSTRNIQGNSFPLRNSVGAFPRPLCQIQFSHFLPS